MPFVFGWLLNAAYLLLLLVIAPVLIFRRLMQGKYRRGWSEKLTGRLVRRHPEKKCLWFHAVSVGEVLQLQKVLDETQSRFPEAEIFLTVTTETGYDVALTKYPQYTVSFYPLDFTWAINKALTAIRPDLIVLVELELWPNLILIARQRQIPLVLINGRIGEKSFRGYRRLKPLMKRLLSSFELLAVQTDTYGDRLKSLGAPPDKVIVTGNIKFDRVESDRGHPKIEELRTAFALQKSDIVVIAGSTQDPEETYAINAWLKLREEFPSLRLIIVPRHKERFDEVAALISQLGCDVIRRTASSSSVNKLASGKPVVALLDTLGELAACWGLADIAFVGGSLTNRGGQNMIEPAGYGAAVLFGPNTWNFKDITEALLSQDAARVVSSPDEMRDTIRYLLQRPDEARRLGEAASAFVASQRGATLRTVDLIESVVQNHNNQSPPIESPGSLGWMRYWPVAKWMLFAIVIACVAQRASVLLQSAPPKSIQIRWPWLILASFFYFVGWLPSAWFWRALLNDLGQPIDRWRAFRAYYIGHLGKYIPGKALVLVIRGSMVAEAGFNGVLGGITAAYETLVFMAAGAALFLATASFVYADALQMSATLKLTWFTEHPRLVAALVFIATFTTTPISAALFSRIGRKAMPDSSVPMQDRPAISARLISLGVATTSIGWCCHTLSLGCVLQSLSDQRLSLNQFPDWLAACTLSTVAGFVVLVAPGGLGVREGFLIESLKDLPEIGPSTAVLAATLLRAVSFVTELIAATVLFLIKPKQ